MVLLSRRWQEKEVSKYRPRFYDVSTVTERMAGENRRAVFIRLIFGGRS